MDEGSDGIITDSALDEWTRGLGKARTRWHGIHWAEVVKMPPRNRLNKKRTAVLSESRTTKFGANLARLMVGS